MFNTHYVDMAKSSFHIVVHDIPDPPGQRVIESMSTCWGNNVGPVFTSHSVMYDRRVLHWDRGHEG